MGDQAAARHGAVHRTCTRVRADTILRIPWKTAHRSTGSNRDDRGVSAMQAVSQVDEASWRAQNHGKGRLLDR